jgi:hypothetical protein
MEPGASTITAWRLSSQGLRQPRWRQPQRVVAWLVGVQAQDYVGAKWSIGLRLREGAEARVQEAIAERQIVRTWAFRGTLHFVAAADFFWLIPLLAPTIIAGNARRYGQLELDEATFASSEQVIRRVLEGGGQRIRSEIASALEGEGISAQGQRLPYLLQRAALDGLICHGPQRGREPTYVLVSDWLGPRRGPDPGDALAALADRYFASHGPATVHDFAWWAGLSMATARKALGAAPSVVGVAAGDRELWIGPGRPPTPAGTTAHLLPPFDDYLLGYRDRSAALAPAYAVRVNPGGGLLKPTIVLNGEVVGIWRSARKGGRTIVSQDLFRDLDRDERAAVGGAVRRYLDFG